MKILKKILKKITYNAKGYSLVELSVSTSVIAIMAVGGLAIMQKKTNANRIEITNEKIQKIENAINSFVKIKGYLPCPALPTLIERDINFGRSENMTLDVSKNIDQVKMYNEANGECSNNALGSLNSVGIVPVRTLKLNSDFAYDGWGRKFTFRISNFAGSKDDFQNNEFRGDIRIVDLYGNNKTNIDNTPPNNDGAIYVVISHGENGKDVAWRKNFDYFANTDAAERPISATGVERQNTVHTIANYVQDEQTSQYDDIVSYGSKNVIIPPKIVQAPIVVDDEICQGASAISSKDSILDDYSGMSNSNKGIAEEISKVAKKISFMCDNITKELSGNINPLDNSGLVLWLDATDIYSNGVKPDDGESISEWVDKSGNGNRAISSGSSRPLYKSDGINKKATLMFDGRNDYMKIEEKFNPNSKDNVSIFLVVKPEKFSGYENERRTLFASDDSYGWKFILSSEQKSSHVFGIFNGKYWSSVSSVNSLNIPNVNLPEALILSYFRNDNESSDQQILNLNGQSISSFSDGDISLSHKYNTNKFIGRSLSGDDSFKGNIGEILIYNRYLSNKMRQGIESSLSNKWRIELNSSSVVNNCPYEGQEFRATSSDPEGGCHCPNGQTIHHSMKNIDACSMGNNVFGKCVEQKYKPDYVSNGFSSPEYPGMLLWLDSNDCTTVKLIDDGTASSNAYVSEWLDKGPKKNNFVNKDDDISTNPRFVLNSDNNLFSSRSYLEFDDNYLISHNTDALNFVRKSEMSIFAVVKSNSFNQKMGSIIGRVSNNYYSDLGWSLSSKYLNDLNKYVFSFALPQQKAHQYNKSSISVHSPYLISAFFDGVSGESSKIHMNGLDDSIFLNINDKNIISSSGPIAHIGSSNDKISSFDGGISEIIVFDNILTKVQVNKITDNYLLPKWGISKSVISTPGNISEGLEVWLDSSDKATLFKNDSCTLTNGSDSSYVKCWKSKVNDYQAKTITRSTPLFNESSTPSSVRFDNSIMRIDNVAPIYLNSTIISVVSLENSNSYSTFIGNKSINENDNFSYGVFGSNLISNLFDATSLVEISYGTEPLELYKDMIITVSDEGKKMYINGKLLSSNSNTSTSKNGSTSISTSTSTNSALYIGSDFSGSNKWRGNINEILVYSRNLESDEIDEVHGILSNKWGVELESSVTPVPQSIGGLQLWLDSADYDGDDNISNNPSNNILIDNWSNKAYPDNSAEQNNDLKKPSFRTNMQNGLPALYFDGHDDFMSVSNYDGINLIQNYTLTAVFNSLYDTSYSYSSFKYPGIISKILNSNEKQYLLSINFPMSAHYLYEKANNNYSVSASPSTMQSNRYYIQTVTVSPSISGKSEIKIYQNGHLKEAGQSSNPGKSDTPLLLGSWGGNTINVESADNGKSFKGFIGEVLMYNKALDFNERSTLEKYLSDKWAITVFH